MWHYGLELRGLRPWIYIDGVGVTESPTAMISRDNAI